MKPIIKILSVKVRDKHAIHKITEENSLIIVGNVSSQTLAKTKMTKSVLDAG